MQVIWRQAAYASAALQAGVHTFLWAIQTKWKTWQWQLSQFSKAFPNGNKNRQILFSRPVYNLSNDVIFWSEHKIVVMKNLVELLSRVAEFLSFTHILQLLQLGKGSTYPAELHIPRICSRKLPNPRRHSYARAFQKYQERRERRAFSIEKCLAKYM